MCASFFATSASITFSFSSIALKACLYPAVPVDSCRTLSSSSWTLFRSSCVVDSDCANDASSSATRASSWLNEAACSDWAVFALASESVREVHWPSSRVHLSYPNFFFHRSVCARKPSRDHHNFHDCHAWEYLPG